MKISPRPFRMSHRLQDHFCALCLAALSSTSIKSLADDYYFSSGGAIQPADPTFILDNVEGVRPIGPAASPGDLVDGVMQYVFPSAPVFESDDRLFFPGFKSDPPHFPGRSDDSGRNDHFGKWRTCQSDES